MGDGTQMNCNEIIHLIDAYLDGSIATESRKEIERHLAECSDCARLAAIHRSVYTSLNDAPKINAPERLADTILAAVEAEEIKANIIEFPGAHSFEKGIDCTVFERHAAAYVDGLLDTGPAAAMDSHRAGCPDCERLFTGHQAVAAALRQTEPEKAPSYVTGRILEAVHGIDPVRERVVSRQYSRFEPLVAACLVGAVAALVIILAGIGFMDSPVNAFMTCTDSLITNATVLPLQAEAWFAAQISPEQWVLIERLTEPVSLPYVPVALPSYMIGMLIVSGAGLACTCRLIQCADNSFGTFCL